MFVKYQKSQVNVHHAFIGFLQRFKFIIHLQDFYKGSCSPCFDRVSTEVHVHHALIERDFYDSSCLSCTDRISTIVHVYHALIGYLQRFMFIMHLLQRFTYTMH